MRSRVSLTGTLSTRTIVSPGRTPAFSAGLPDSTDWTNAPSCGLQVEGRGPVGVDVHDVDAEEAAHDLPLLAKLRQDGLERVDRNGEPDVLGRPEHRGVDADDLAVDVDQRPAGVAEVDRRVGLDVVLEAPRGRVRRQARAVLGGDDADRDGLVEVERIADRHDPLADAELDPSRPSGSGVRRCLTSTLRRARSVAGIPADELGRVLLPVVDPDLDLVGALDDVVVRHDVAVFRDDEAGSALDFLVLLVVPGLSAAVLAARRAEEELERIAVAAEGVQLETAAAVALDDVGRGDRDQRRHRLLAMSAKDGSRTAAGAGPGRGSRFPLRLGPGGHVDRARRPPSRRRRRRRSEPKRTGRVWWFFHEKRLSPQVVPWRDMDGTRLASSRIPRFRRDSQPLVLDQDAAVHGHADPRAPPASGPSRRRRPPAA